jgi:hypothetical protein
LEFVPLEEDLLSLEMDDVARDLYLVCTSCSSTSGQADSQHGDDTPIYYSSLALMTFQRAFGLFPRILGKGDGAKVSCRTSYICRKLTGQKLADLLRRHQQSGLTQYADLDVSDSVDSLIILDRSVDWVTPMCTQLTYEGMIDEFIGIKNCE